VVLVPEPDCVLLIRRAERPGDPWSGQIGFPGGRRHAEDPDLRVTALRETAEEVGLHLSRGAQIGQLDDLAPLTPTPVPVLVRPFVFALDRRPSLSPNREVAGVLWTPLSDLRQPANFRPTTLLVRGEPRTYPAYHLGSDLVWGLTERILSPLLALLP
jgi:8-oxo-dGTP pyrophosphatase MutT (NUDIX family)